MIPVQPEVGVAFWMLAFVIIMSGAMVVSLRNIFHCALCLIICLSAVAGIFILLEAEFLAAAQVLIYVGAVSILIIFAVMLTSNLAVQKIVQTNENALVAFVICLVFMGGTCALVDATHVWRYTAEALPANNTLEIGRQLMTDYMLPFEVVSILLIAALIGAIMLAREEKT
ncbi:MAG: NADH-quinone oxidoreductase subunit J [candidate division Zixibacteria bacterium]|nr:NADH-quinone oxidoreductase subunit J [candidate division Zixibacteria bacterium]